MKAYVSPPSPGVGAANTKGKRATVTNERQRIKERSRVEKREGRGLCLTCLERMNWPLCYVAD